MSKNAIGDSSLAPRRRLFAVVALAAAGLFTVGCGGDDEAGGGPGLTGTVVDAVTGNPIGGALFAIESGGTYIENKDTSKGNPSYVYGGVSAADGTYTIKLPAELVGIHVFADGYRYWPKTQRIADDGSLTEVASTPEPQLASDLQPTLSGASFEPAKVAAGGVSTLKVTASALPGDSPLSEEILVVFPEALFCKALDPPSPGVQGFGYPDGLYQTEITAPSAPGTYTYYLVASAENCVTAQRVTATLTVE